ncbi:MAG: preprotein translocase subunit SecA [Parcubacteria group bacterium]|nr:preprotein translocase subunit SecA [Parcubacteria group bacterium]
MLQKIFTQLFGEGRILKAYRKKVVEINAQEEALKNKTDEELRELSHVLRDVVGSDERMIRGFALVREAARRTLKQRHYDVQLIGGMVLYEGDIAQMATGEGKTLVATLPAYTHALKQSVHVVTVNDYLAKRDAVWMGQIYYFLGLTTSCITSEGSFFYDPTHLVEEKKRELDTTRDKEGGFRVVENFLKPISRKEAYEADIVYGTNTEFGFDYLRDNLVHTLDQKVQRGHHFAIVDEIDSILIDEARTPLIISASQEESSDLYREMAQVVKRLKENEDYLVDRKLHSATFTEEGITKIESMLRLPNAYDPAGFRYLHYLESSLKAQALYHKDKEYVVKDGEIIIVDEFTGRMLLGRRYSGGLHQAIEAKERVAIKKESRTLASVTIQNYFRLYTTLSGMTGTAKTSAEEFHKVYGLDVIEIPTNRPMVRKDKPDFIFQTKNAKWVAVIEEIKKRNELGQPVLVGTTSIENNEIVSTLLHHEGVHHQVLNAKQHEKEGGVIAQAGKYKGVTVATNMAGRGVDVILGGNPPVPEDMEKIKQLGGLYVIGTEKHESRRIDNQLRGRSGRQGDHGESRFFISLDDDLVKIFGGEKLKEMMQRMNVPESMPIESPLVTRMIEAAQSKVEGFHFDARKRTLEYDDVLNKQRYAVYKKRDDILRMANDFVAPEFEDTLMDAMKEFVRVETAGPLSEWNFEEFVKMCASNRIIDNAESVLKEIEKCIEDHVGREDEESRKALQSLFSRKIEEAFITHRIEDKKPVFLKSLLLTALDQLWMDQLDVLDELRESVQLRAYGQHDPIVEFKNESHRLFKDLFVSWKRSCLLYFRAVVESE